MTEPTHEPFPKDPDAPEAEAYDPASESGRVLDAPPSGSAAAGDRSLATLAHLGGLLWIAGLAVLAPAAPLLLWYLFRRDDALVERHAKEACNFQLNMLLWLALSIALCSTCVLVVIGLPLMVIVTALAVVMSIVAAVRTSKGEDFRYPWIFRCVD